MSRNYERSPAIDLGQPIFRIKNCSLFLPMNSHFIARVLSPKNLTIFSFFFYRKGDQYEFFKNEEIHFRIFLNATKSNKTNVFEVSCLQVYERFRDTQRIDIASLHHRSPISVRKKPRIHCHCFLFFSFFILLALQSAIVRNINYDSAKYDLSLAAITRQTSSMSCRCTRMNFCFDASRFVLDFS